MAQNTVINPTIYDFERRTDQAGKIDKIIEMASLTNEVLLDMTSIEGNQTSGHKTTIRTGLPTATWRLLNYGVQPSKSQTAQVVDVAGQLEAYAEVDKKLADLNGNTAEFRLSEDRAFIESMNQEMVNTMFYGDINANPEKFHGLAARYAAADTDMTKIGYNVLKAGGSGSVNTSIWAICWSPETITTFYPKGTEAGLKHQDLGEVTLLDANNGKYQGYRSHYEWNIGLCVRDWRYATRIANVDMTNLLTAGDSSDTSANILKYMSMAIDQIPNPNMGRLAFYMHPKVISMLRIKLLNQKQTFLSLDDWTTNGVTKKVLSFMGYPIRRVDKLLLTEATVS